MNEDIFIKFTPNFDKLLEYGFKKNKKDYSIQKIFMNNSFKAVITVSGSGKVSGTVYDLENDEEFLPLRIENQEGAFIGEVKSAYINILTDIREKCFTENYFASKQGNRITNLIYQKYKDKPLFLWDDSPDAGVFKNPESLKWYGIIMYIKRTSLGEPSEEMVEVMNVKLDKDKIPELHKRKGFYPAYHMNKKYWITMTFDETLSDEEIMKLIDESHSYTLKKRSKAVKV